MNKNLKVLISLTALTVCLSVVAFAQTPDQKPKKQRGEASSEEILKRFVTEDVPYIITDAEKDAFNKLQTNEERENFIDIFWRNRDTNLDTEENEYRDAYYERIAYANEKFSSGTPGWRTDRGRIYITFGPPDSIESHPSGGSYDRPSYEGGGSTTTYPFETWFYRHLENVGDGLEVEFVDPSGTGEYRLARDAYEKDALKMVPGAGQTLREQLGLESRADRLIGQNASYQREQDSPFSRMDVARRLFTPPPVDRRTQMENSPTGVLDNNPLNFDVRVDYFRRSDENVVVTFTIQSKNDQLEFKDVGGIQIAMMNITGKITQVSGKNAGGFQDVVTTSSTAEELRDKNSRSSIYQTSVVLPAGIYKTQIKVREVEGGKAGTKDIGINVPRYEAAKLSTSTMILASRLYQTTEKDIGAMFVIGDKKVVPNLAREFRKGQEIGLYMQVYGAGIDQTTLRPSVDVEYILTRNGNETMRQKEDWNSLSEAGQRLVLAKFLDSSKLSSGEYKLSIRINDRVTGLVIEPTERFTVVD